MKDGHLKREAGAKFWEGVGCQHMEQLDIEQEKSSDCSVWKLKMGERHFSVDVSSKVLVAMNQG